MSPSPHEHEREASAGMVFKSSFFAIYFVVVLLLYGKQDHVAEVVRVRLRVREV